MKTLLNTIFIIIFSLFLFACSRESFSSFFKDLASEIPQQEIYYTIPNPQSDTLIVWFSPYQIFENKTKFANDTIIHTEKFNWGGLGSFLYDKYQERKERRKNIDETIKDSEKK